MRTNADLTLYNIYYDTDDKENKYLRTVIKAVSWENRKARNKLASGGNIASDQAAIYIPLARGSTFLGAKAWLALSEIEKVKYWTLQRGDLLVKGEVADELSSSFLPTALKAKYDDVLEISEIDKMDMGSLAMRHWNVTGK